MTRFRCDAKVRLRTMLAVLVAMTGLVVPMVPTLDAAQAAGGGSATATYTATQTIPVPPASNLVTRPRIFTPFVPAGATI